MKSALNKDFVRDIKNSKGRFISILLIVALGVAFFAGIKDAPLVMKKTSDSYYDDSNLMDIRITSTLGLTDDDVDAIKKINKVDGIKGTYSMEAISNYKDKDSVVQIQSINLSDYKQNNKNYMNRLKVVKGRLPQKSGECVIEKSKYQFLAYPIGSKVTLDSGTDEDISDSLNKKEYTVVGYVNTPYYLSHEKGNASIGGGRVQGAMMILDSDFKLDVYTDIYLTVKGAKALDTYSDEYQELIDSVVHDIDKITDDRIKARYDEVVSEAQDKLNESKQKYEDNKAKAEKEIDDAQTKINKSKTELERGKLELESQKSNAKRKIQTGKVQIENAKKQLKSGRVQYENALKEFKNQKKKAQGEFKKAESKIKDLELQKSELENGIAQINLLLKDENLSEEQKLYYQNELKTMNSNLEQLKSGISSAKKELNSQKQKLQSSENKLKQTKQTLDSNKIKIKQSEIELKQSEKTANNEIQKAEQKIKSGEEEIQNAQTTLDNKKQEVQEKLSKAENEIKKAQREINKIEKPTWYVLDRDSHRSFVEYEGCANSIDALAKIFPVFFFAVAALVCLTTMTRMVDEQRINIGTLKALGYTVFAIAKKYILYAFTASIIGSILGLLIGFSVFPIVIFYAYGMMYTLPDMIPAIDIKLAISITLIAILVTTLSAYTACKKELMEEPSALMRPKAPKNGKRILLERIDFIWKRLSFISKVTLRNIFRYKKRFLMTVLGIAGCTALLVTGFGIKDSIQMIVSGQYGELLKYDMEISISNKTTDSEIKDMASKLNKTKNIKEYEFFVYENGEVKTNEGSEDVNIVIPDDLNKFNDFIHLRQRVGHKKINLKDDGLVLSEKAARVIGASVGDTIKLKNSDNITVEAKVSDITENYISHYAYMTKNYYNKLFNNIPSNNKVLGILNRTSSKEEDKLSKELINIDGVSGVVFNTVSKQTFSNTIKNLNYVVLIMIISAGALAFVVLYNLTNVNISERIREIATIKVLGFYDGETAAYIYRENIILTIVGIIVGLIMGKFLHQYIMTTVEIKSMMFGRVINTKSYIIAAILTVLLSLIVNVVMYYKLKNVKMVESLKSVD
ncbi:FtsX-like permease family protein [Intestinibacter bartlettii]|uniref:FtsX-like permease family protein n=1 Tax=Intestinibacter bartlettii TaxID=261299 RepID=UPI00016310BA|nr:FtsX-like permease family protein [Intestinibacter bartlettii]EDQ97098.1 efflux ABC transporter, permease protein [Intestinibacter bartlettii DSM 16795]MDU6472915.1 FtsX-like permease family protein [Intestinibacter bartlettii]UWO81893.1 FtsX-like permease family protein [Intestinibacter bartlettii]SKA61175.1 putative ABC transport system permease protein [Intestinibacter bartlettii DSM 16795]